jgi:glyoxylase I family protein
MKDRGMGGKICKAWLGMGLLAVVLAGCQESSMRRKTEVLTGTCLGFEHIGLNVSDPQASADWYCKNLGMQVVRNSSPTAFFLADAGRHMMLEIYHNAQAPVPDYESIQVLSVHLSFMADHLEVFRARLMAAGARPVGDVTTSANGDKVANLRDPWGVPLQFVQRAEPMLGPAKAGAASRRAPQRGPAGSKS